MTIGELAKILSTMFHKVPHKEKSSMILLFGIRYAEIIETNKYSVKEILQLANLPASYQNGVNKGIKLAIYVVEK